MQVSGVEPYHHRRRTPGAGWRRSRRGGDGLTLGFGLRWGPRDGRAGDERGQEGKEEPNAWREEEDAAQSVMRGNTGRTNRPALTSDITEDLRHKFDQESSKRNTSLTFF